MLETSTLINILLGVYLAWFMYRKFAPVKGVKHISTIELKSELNSKDKQFIDVRTPNEFQANRINEFKNIPLYELPKRANELSKEKEVFVICQSGMRSSKASKLLKKLGFKHITNVKGGMSAW
ncbi:rhodanese-like domain-containing protein [Domibacillus sp. A3M-37]|uniref:rhodanese-like domain-containing protein n=1 Tax=Domibacillus sp. A3M-37 TaxID=2962037 RepID=UPI0020B6E00C|nr:rhodanese-like domain-containing protein [Domibacillus sp. A3M-37]MCP3764980.1 rhodanese-like domain-containing protein [Domibacillus sp. A3M-37]